MEKIRPRIHSGSFVGQKLSLMLDRAPSWPHLGLGAAQVSEASDKVVRIEGALNDLGFDGELLYEVVEESPGAASVRLRINSNKYNFDSTKMVSCIERGANRVVFYDSASYKRIAALDYRDCSLMPKGIEVFDHNSPDDACCRMYIDYQ